MNLDEVMHNLGEIRKIWNKNRVKDMALKMVPFLYVLQYKIFLTGV